VRSLAALALGSLGDRRALGPLLRVLREDDDRDPWLRHAAVMGLAGAGDVPSLLAHADDASEAVRLGLCLALRRLASPHVARFLEDPAARVAVEAARAVHDLPLEAATPALAAVLNRREVQESPLVRRAIAAGYRLGGLDAAQRLATFAARVDGDPDLRVLALDALADWAHPSGRDRVLDLWRPIPDRGAEHAREALAVHVEALVRRAPEAVAAAAARAAAALGMVEFAELLESAARDERRGGKVRAAALAALERLGSPQAASTAAALASSSESALRQAATRVVSRLDPEAAVGVLDALAGSAPLDERQNAFRALGESTAAAADASLVRWLEAALRGELPPEVHLDLLEAAARRVGREVAAKVAAWEASRRADDPLAPWRETLVGGDLRAGDRLFWNHEAAACTRCHALKDSGGTAGPPLDHIGDRLTREQLLEALVLPQARIAAGFGTVVVVRKSGAAVAGILRGEHSDALVVQTPEGEVVEVKAADVDSRSPAVSAMPPMAAILSKRELRDVIEFLTSLREAKDAGEKRR
jgi:quinoprotein glucose dehydrogenase